MQRRSDLIGRRVVSLDRGSELDRVSDLVVDRARNRVVALLLQRGRWLQHPRVVPLGAVQSFGHDAVMVPSAAAIADVESVPDIKVAYKRSAHLAGTKVLSAGGTQLGIIRDVQFDEHSGAVSAFEVSQNMLDDLMTGRTVLSTEGDLVMGTDAVIVSEAAEHEFLERQHKVEAEIVGPSRPPVAEACGDVESQENVTHLPAHKTFGDHVREAVHQLGEATSSFWETAKQAAGELREEAKDVIAEQRIRRVLGLKVDRDIYGADGRPILVRGQIITPLAVAQARTVGALDRVLSAATSQSLEVETKSHLITPDGKPI